MRSGWMTSPPARLRDLDHAPVDVGGDAADHVLRRAGRAACGQLRRTSSTLPPMPPLVTITASARSSKLPTASRLEETPRAQSSGARIVPDTPSTAPAVTRQRVDAVAEAQVCARGPHAPLERLDHARPGAPGEVEARDRVAVPDRAVAAALGPADVRHPLHAHRRQPGALLAGREVDVGLGPAARPVVVRAVEAGRPEPVLPRQLARILDPQAPLLRTIDHEEPAEGPERLPAERGLRLLLERGSRACPPRPARRWPRARPAHRRPRSRQHPSPHGDARARHRPRPGAARLRQRRLRRARARVGAAAAAGRQGRARHGRQGGARPRDRRGPGGARGDGAGAGPR